VQSSFFVQSTSLKHSADPWLVPQIWGSGQSWIVFEIILSWQVLLTQSNKTPDECKKSKREVEKIKRQVERAEKEVEKAHKQFDKRSNEAEEAQKRLDKELADFTTVCPDATPPAIPTRKVASRKSVVKSRVKTEVKAVASAELKVVRRD